MAVVSAQTLTIDGIPNVGVLILGAGEEKVTFPVVTDLSNGLFVSMQANRLHFVFFCEKSKLLLFSAI